MAFLADEDDFTHYYNGVGRMAERAEQKCKELEAENARLQAAMRRWMSPTPVCAVCGGPGFLAEPEGDKLQPCYACRRLPDREAPL